VRPWPHLGFGTGEGSYRSNVQEETVGKRGDWTDELDGQVADEVRYIIDAFANPESKQRAKINGVAEGGGVGYMYAEDRLLVLFEYLGPVLLTLWEERHESKAQETFALDRFGVEPVIGGVVLLTLAEFGLDVRTALDVIDQRLGEGIATPDHVLTVTPVCPCPATEPETVYDPIEPTPGVCWDNSGAGILIYIGDTGLLSDAASHPWLRHGVTGDTDPMAAAAGGAPPPIPAYTGHGTFVAGVARCMAPAADIFVADIFDTAGSALESHMVRRLVQALGRGVDIFHLSIAATTRKDLHLVAFEKWLKLLHQQGGVVCVVAAGNGGSRRPSWPAAFSEVVSVGALAADRRDRAVFSNYGGWVDVYAPGRNLINAYATGIYTCHVQPYVNTTREFYGMAQWSGTSFSTPIVTGLIAARMFRTGESGRIAAAALLHEARAQAIPGVGPILLPCGGSADARRCECCCGHHKRPCAC
jgi:Subtilase family